MNCPVCGGEMQPLFTSHYCPWCEQRGASSGAMEDHYGFVIWRNRPPGSSEYVFKTLRDAEVWRTSVNLTAFPIRVVTANKPFVWRNSGGYLPCEIAGVFEIYEETHTELHESAARLVLGAP